MGASLLALAKSILLWYGCNCLSEGNISDTLAITVNSLLTDTSIKKDTQLNNGHLESVPPCFYSLLLTLSNGCLSNTDT